MNPFEIFDTEERKTIAKFAKTMENRVYTKEEWFKVENEILEGIMNQSYKSGKIDEARNECSRILNKFETYNKVTI